LQFEPREQFEQRQKKLEQIQARLKAYPHEFRWERYRLPSWQATLARPPSADLEANQRESPGCWANRFAAPM